MHETLQCSLYYSYFCFLNTLKLFSLNIADYILLQSTKQLNWPVDLLQIDASCSRSKPGFSLKSM